MLFISADLKALCIILIRCKGHKHLRTVCCYRESVRYFQAFFFAQCRLIEFLGINASCLAYRAFPYRGDLAYMFRLISRGRNFFARCYSSFFGKQVNEHKDI